MNKILLILLITTPFFASCGGSSSSSNGVLFQGQLTQGEATDHKLFKHAAEENIKGVEICALGECSTTDDQGEWGFIVDPTFHGGNVAFKITGHGIETTTNVTISEVQEDVFIHFENQTDQVIVHHLLVDGAEPVVEDHSHQGEEHEDENHSH